MKNLTIRRRILASFAVVLALMVIMAAVAYTRLTSIERQAALIASDALPGSAPTPTRSSSIESRTIPSRRSSCSTRIWPAKQKIQAAHPGEPCLSGHAHHRVTRPPSPSGRQESVRRVQERRGRLPDGAGRRPESGTGREGGRAMRASKRISDRALSGIRKNPVRRRSPGGLQQDRSRRIDAADRHGGREREGGRPADGRRGAGRRLRLRLLPAPGDFAAAQPVGHRPRHDAHRQSIRPIERGPRRRIRQRGDRVQSDDRGAGVTRRTGPAIGRPGQHIGERNLPPPPSSSRPRRARSPRPRSRSAPHRREISATSKELVRTMTEVSAVAEQPPRWPATGRPA